MLRIICAGFLVTVLGGASCVDVIDGAWCAHSGEQLSINGPLIKLPSDVTLPGEHHTHAFSYWPSNGARDYGNMVYMRLEDSGHMSLYHVKDGNPGVAETWKRCDVNS